VARDFSQRQKIDYEDTFTLIMRMDSLRFLLAIVAIKDLEYHQIDINNAFTESKMNEIIYIIPPEGVKIPRGTALRVLKSLYSLKQAVRDWYNYLSEALLKIGF
jgi:Reverse transcriptase (RNA-dependent DNA polymerase)